MAATKDLTSVRREFEVLAPAVKFMKEHGSVRCVHMCMCSANVTSMRAHHCMALCGIRQRVLGLRM